VGSAKQHMARYTQTKLSLFFTQPQLLTLNSLMKHSNIGLQLYKAEIIYCRPNSVLEITGLWKIGAWVMSRGWMLDNRAEEILTPILCKIAAALVLPNPHVPKFWNEANCHFASNF
jgi:hypothetical protein